MQRWMIFGALALLAACGTPQERCISRASKELRTFDKLIAETRATLSRGYGLRQEPYTTSYRATCAVGKDAAGKIIYEPCTKERIAYRDVPVAVDLDEERRKLAGLETRRAQEARRVQSAAAQCRAQFPE